jgi:predicted SAM-dependent methyltransferase/GT2 family glycosyltransferase
MKVFALVPVHNRVDDTRRSIECLRRQTHKPIEVIVIDDGSSDGTADYLAQQPDVTTLRGKGNLWWAGSIQRGLSYALRRASNSDYVLLINNDTTFDEHFVSTLVRVSGGAAVVGAILRDASDPSIVLGLAPVLDIWGMRVWERFTTLPESERVAPKVLYEADALSGRGVLYPARAFRVGGQMRRLLLPHYYADYELAMRMRRHGFPVLVSTEAVVYSRNEFGVQREPKTWLETFFGERSHRNVLRRAAFFSLVGTTRERLTAIPRMSAFGLQRMLASLPRRPAGVSWLRHVAELAARRLLLAARRAKLQLSAAARGRALKIIVGANGTSVPGWLSTDYPCVDVTDTRTLRRLFGLGRVSAILAEHVWEHLSNEQARLAARNCYALLRPGAYVRVAVPDGNHPDPIYIDRVRPGGCGPGANDHKVLYNLDTLSEVFRSAGFRVEPLEWFDTSGRFCSSDWDPRDGHIQRSARFDPRNRERAYAYTSVVIDALKPLTNQGG